MLYWVFVRVLAHLWLGYWSLRCQYWISSTFTWDHDMWPLLGDYYLSCDQCYLVRLSVVLLLQNSSTWWSCRDVTIQWTGLLDWHIFGFCTFYGWIYGVLLVSIFRAPLNTEDEQWNMRKLSYNNFTTIHYATIQHLLLTLVCSNAAGSAGNVAAVVNQWSTCQ